MVISLPIYKKNSGSIPGCGVGFVSSGELFQGIYGLEFLCLCPLFKSCPVLSWAAEAKRRGGDKNMK